MTMAHYAFLDKNNVVTEVIVGNDEADTDWETHYGLFRNQNCKKTSYNTKGGIHYDTATGEPSEDQSKAFRKNYAGIGDTYDPGRDAFIAPKPFGSWALDEFSCLWIAPSPIPTEGGPWKWNEDSLSWVEITP